MVPRLQQDLIYQEMAKDSPQAQQTNPHTVKVFVNEPCR
jgi:hypothetical protein